MPPFNEVGYIALQMSVGPSVGRVGRPYLVWMKTRHRIELDSSNLAQTWGVDDPY